MNTEGFAGSAAWNETGTSSPISIRIHRSREISRLRRIVTFSPRAGIPTRTRQNAGRCAESRQASLITAAPHDNPRSAVRQTGLERARLARAAGSLRLDGISRRPKARRSRSNGNGHHRRREEEQDQRGDPPERAGTPEYRRPGSGKGKNAALHGSIHCWEIDVRRLWRQGAGICKPIAQNPCGTRLLEV